MYYYHFEDDRIVTGPFATPLACITDAASTPANVGRKVVITSLVAKTTALRAVPGRLPERMALVA